MENEKMKNNGVNRPLNSRERMKIAMSNKMPDRIPTMPQICHNHAISLFYDDFRNGIMDTIKNPEKMNMKKMYRLLFIHYFLFIIGLIIISLI